MKSYVNKIAIGAMCVALSSFVLSLFTIRVSEALQIGFTELPIIFSGAFLGPVFGGLVGFTVDLLKMLKYGYPPSVYTLAPIALGAVPGIVMVLVGKKKFYNNKLLIFLTVYLAMNVRTFFTSLGLYYVTGTPLKAIIISLPPKLLMNTIESVIYSLLLFTLLAAAKSIFDHKME